MIQGDSDNGGNGRCQNTFHQMLQLKTAAAHLGFGKKQGQATVSRLYLFNPAPARIYDQSRIERIASAARTAPFIGIRHLQST